MCRRAVAIIIPYQSIAGSQSFGRCPSSLNTERNTGTECAKDRRDAKRRDGSSVYQPSVPDNLAYRRGMCVQTQRLSLPSTRSCFSDLYELPTNVLYVRRYNLNAKNSFEYSDTRYYFYTRDTASASSRQRPREYTRLRKDTGSRLLLDGGVGGGFNFIGMAVIFHFSPSSSLPISSLSWITRHPPRLSFFFFLFSFLLISRFTKPRGLSIAERVK